MESGKNYAGKFWRFALPSMLSQLLNSLFIIVDGFYIGQNMGDAGLAAINVAWPMVAVIFKHSNDWIFNLEEGVVGNIESEEMDDDFGRVGIKRNGSPHVQIPR